VRTTARRAMHTMGHPADSTVIPQTLSHSCIALTQPSPISRLSANSTVCIPTSGCLNPAHAKQGAFLRSATCPEYTGARSQREPRFALCSAPASLACLSARCIPLTMLYPSQRSIPYGQEDSCTINPSGRGFDSRRAFWMQSAAPFWSANCATRAL